MITREQQRTKRAEVWARLVAHPRHDPETSGLPDTAFGVHHPDLVREYLDLRRELYNTPLWPPKGYTGCDDDADECEALLEGEPTTYHDDPDLAKSAGWVVETCVRGHCPTGTILCPHHADQVSRTTACEVLECEYLGDEDEDEDGDEDEDEDGDEYLGRLLREARRVVEVVLCRCIRESWQRCGARATPDEVLADLLRHAQEQTTGVELSARYSDAGNDAATERWARAAAVALCEQFPDDARKAVAMWRGR